MTTPAADLLLRYTGGWVNGNAYERSSESLGILPLSSQSREMLGMLPYNPSFAKDYKIRHQHLAKQQGTRMAILPVHTPEERSIFRLLVNEPNGLFSQRTQPNWNSVAVRWSSYCDGVNIFYKVSVQLSGGNSSVLM